MMKFDADKLTKAATKAAQDAITKRLQNIRCSVHGRTAKAVPKTSGSRMTWDISGCCKELVAKVKAALK